MRHQRNRTSFLLILAVAVLGVLPLEAAIYTFTYRNDVGGDCATSTSDNAYAMGGDTSEIAYYTGGNGAVETNHGSPNGCLPYGHNTDYPLCNTNTGLKANDEGTLTCRSSSVCSTVLDTANLDFPDPAAAGNRFVFASVYVMNDAASKAYTGNSTALTATGANLHVAYFGWEVQAPGNHAWENTSFDMRAQRQLHPMQAGSLVVTSGGPAADGGVSSFPHLQFPASIMPPPLPVAAVVGSGVPMALGEVKYGVRIYRSTVSPLASVAFDFALATNTVVNPSNATVRWDGGTPSGSYFGKNTVGDYFFNDFANDVEANPNSNYIAVPVLVPDTKNANGVYIHMAGSWFNPGQNSPAASGLPTPVKVTSFDATFDPRTGRVTLNWKTANEDDLSGFHIWRELYLDGQPLGARTWVGWVPAQTGLANVGADYAFNDTISASQYARFVRGKSIEAVYYLEEEDLNGARHAVGTTNAILGTRASRRQ